LKGIPDPTLQIFSDPIPDPGKNPTGSDFEGDSGSGSYFTGIFGSDSRSGSKSNCFTKSEGENFRNHLEVVNNGTAVLFSPIFNVWKYLLTSKFYISDMK